MSEAERASLAAAEPLAGFSVEAHDARFAGLVLANVRAEVLWRGGRWLEGPLWLADAQQLVFSDIPNDRVLRWVPGLGVGLLSRGGFQNGRTRDRDGRVVACEHGGRRLVRQEIDGGLTVLADRFEGRRLNSPNDVVCGPDGALWFSDPDYGILSDHEGRRADREQAGCHVFRVVPGAAEPEAVVSTLTRPNGLGFSPDGRWLYVADSGGSHDPACPPEIHRFAVRPEGGGVQAQGVLARLGCGLPDGLAVDALGNVWSSAGDGVHCFAPDGTLLGSLRLGGVVSNLCFGGDSGNRLFVTMAQQLVSVYLGVRGA